MTAALLAAIAQLSIAVTVPDSIEVRQGFMVNVVVNSPSLLPPTISPPSFRGFSHLGTTSNTRVVSARGREHAVIEVNYHLMANAVGSYMLQAFEARLDSARVRSRPVTMRIRDRVVVAGAAEIPLVTRRTILDPGRAVNIGVIGTPDTVYVGEQATYEVAVFIDEAVLRQRAARNPTFTPPDLRGTLSYEIPPINSFIPPRRSGERTFRPHVYQRAIFPLVPGNHVVPAATLDYSLPSTQQPFGPDEPVSLRADSVLIVALAIPSEGRPADFSGAVGQLRLERSLSTFALRVGEPFTLRTRIVGTGNIKLLPRPTLEIPWADVLTAGERVELNIVNARVGGLKEFEWVVTPREAGMQQIPAVQYSFFDPAAGKYAAASSRTESIEVLPGSLVVADESTTRARPSLGIRRPYRGERGAPFASSVFFAAVAAAAPLPALLLLLVRRRRAAALRKRSDEPAAAMPRGTGGSRAALATARRDFLRAIEKRLNLPPGAAAVESEFRRALLRGGVSRETTADAERLVHELDTAVFGAEADAGGTLAARASECYRRINAEAAKGRASRVTVLLPMFMLVSVALLPQRDQSARVLFDGGVRLYAAGEFAQAAERFLEVTRLHPRSPDAWANLGAAAWETGDTAAAMVSWHRALRIEPSASDVRRNISRLAPDNVMDRDWIPPVSFDFLAIFALGSWVVGWSLLLAGVMRDAKGFRTLAVFCVVVAVLAGAAAYETYRRVSDRRVAVITRSVVSRSLPSLESQSLTRLASGETVRMTALERDWSSIELHGRAVGWVHNTNIMRIAH